MDEPVKTSPSARFRLAVPLPMRVFGQLTHVDESKFPEIFVRIPFWSSDTTTARL
jgi:hypothetical protein